MIFFLNLIFSILYCDYIGRDKYVQNHYTKRCLFLPLLFSWTLICGSQYYVGTDYPSYIYIFSGNNLDYFSGGGEYGFVLLIKFFNYIGFKGQDLYFIFYFITFLILYKIIDIIDIKYWSCYILLYIVVSSIFNNQLNIIRQSVTIYLGTWAAINIYNRKKVKALLLIIFATLFHLSAIFFVVFFLFPKRLRAQLSRFKLLLVITAGVIGGLMISLSFFDLFIDYLPSAYAWHLQSGSIEEINTINKITKYIFVPLYLMSIYYLPKLHLCGIDRWLFNWGIIGFGTRLLVMNLQIINRLSFIFLLISLFPLLYLLIYLIKEKRKLTVTFIYLGLILFYSIKVIIMPSNEYDYDSIFFHLI